MKKFRIEQLNNGFLVVVNEGKDEFLGRWTFVTIDDVFEFVRSMCDRQGQ